MEGCGIEACGLLGLAGGYGGGCGEAYRVGRVVGVSRCVEEGGGLVWDSEGC